MMLMIGSIVVPVGHHWVEFYLAPSVLKYNIALDHVKRFIGHFTSKHANSWQQQQQLVQYQYWHHHHHLHRIPPWEESVCTIWAILAL